MLNLKRHLMAPYAYALFAAVLAFQPTIAAADTVTLKAHDGTIAITGSLLSYSDGIHVIDTDLGELRIPAEQVMCHGAACPSPEQVKEDVSLQDPASPWLWASVNIQGTQPQAS